MNFRRILGTFLLICGIGMVIVSNVIKTRVEEGKMEVAGAQKKVNQADSLFSLSPVTKNVGKGMTDSAQKQIDEGKQQINEYTILAGRLQIGGIVVGILGITSILLGGIKRKSRPR